MGPGNASKTVPVTPRVTKAALAYYVLVPSFFGSGGSNSKGWLVHARQDAGVPSLEAGVPTLPKAFGVALSVLAFEQCV